MAVLRHSLELKFLVSIHSKIIVIFVECKILQWSDMERFTFVIVMLKKHSMKSLTIRNVTCQLQNYDGEAWFILVTGEKFATWKIEGKVRFVGGGTEIPLNSILRLSFRSFNSSTALAIGLKSRCVYLCVRVCERAGEKGWNEVGGAP